MVAGDLYGDLAGERADSSHRRALGPHQSMCGELTDDDVMLRYDGELVGVTVLHASTSRRVLRKTRFGLEGSLPPRYSAAVAADRVCDKHEAAEPDAPSRCRSWCRSRREMKRRSAKLIEVQNLAKTSVLADHPDKSKSWVFAFIPFPSWTSPVRPRSPLSKETRAVASEADANAGGHVVVSGILAFAGEPIETKSGPVRIVLISGGNEISADRIS